MTLSFKDFMARHTTASIYLLHPLAKEKMKKDYLESINLESITDSAFASRLRSESASLAARVTESPVNVGR